MFAVRLQYVTSACQLNFISSYTASAQKGEDQGTLMAIISARKRVAVVGGGVVGCATAYALARAGCQVTLIERDAIAAHASRHNAGNLNPLHGTAPELIPLALKAFGLHAQLRMELADLNCGDFDARPIKRIHLGYDDADKQDLETTAALANGTPHFSARWIDSEGLSRLEPRLDSNLRFGLITSGAWTIDSGCFTRSLATAAVRLGAEIVTAPVLGVKSSGERISAIRASSALVPCDEVIFATGPWIGELNSWLGTDLRIEAVKGELLLLQLPGTPIEYDFTLGSICLYRRRRNEIWVGGTTTHAGLDETPTQGAKDFLMASAARLMPAIRDARLLDHVAALRPVGPSNKPIATCVAGWQNIYVANGGGYKGVLFSALIARRMRDLVLSGRSE